MFGYAIHQYQGFPFFFFRRLYGFRLYGFLVRRLYFGWSDFTGLLNVTGFFILRLVYSIFLKKRENKIKIIFSLSFSFSFSPFFMSLGNHPAALYIVANSNWLEGGGRRRRASEQAGGRMSLRRSLRRTVRRSYGRSGFSEKKG